VQARELTVEEAERPLDWHYPEPYETYDAAWPLGSDRGFFAVDDDSGELVGYGCVGAEARVPGVEEEAGTVDVGYGMRPDLIGHGRGREWHEGDLEVARKPPLRRHGNERIGSSRM